jgi:predicted kinase
VILLLNGAFGIGKTSVARVLVSRLPRAVLYDPEILGIALQRAARLAGIKVADFQDLRLWRRLTVIALRVVRMFWPNVIVPMAFSNAAYLQEIRAGISRFESRQLHFCLVAPIEVVRHRLQNRRLRASDAAWQDRRAAECCDVHGQDVFATQIHAAERTVVEIADEIIGRLPGRV